MVVVVVDVAAAVGAEGRAAVDGRDLGAGIAIEDRGTDESKRRGDRAGVDMLQENSTLEETLGAQLGRGGREQQVHENRGRCLGVGRLWRSAAVGQGSVGYVWGYELGSDEVERRDRQYDITTPTAS